MGFAKTLLLCLLFKILVTMKTTPGKKNCQQFF
jgi:hypothetical protein